MDELESLNNELEKLKKIRKEYELAVDGEKEVEEEKVEETADIRKSVEEELESIDKEIKELEEEIKKAAKEYEDSYKKLQTIVDEYEEKVGDTNLLSEEEIEELRKSTEAYKMTVNEQSVEIKKRLDDQKKMIRDLKSKKTILKKVLANAEGLGLSYDEYKLVTSTIRKSSIMNAILEEQGLGSIIEKPAKDRTPEEKELLKKAKDEILKKISEFKSDPEYDDYTILDIIEALFSLDTKYIRVEPPRKTKTPRRNLNFIYESKKMLPFKFQSPNFRTTKTKTQEAPKDMEDAQQNEKVDLNELKPAEEKVTLFKDTDTADYYVRKYAVDRFKLKSADLGNEVRINGSICYKISEYDVNRIKENANNAFSPYIADVKEITLEKEQPKTNDYEILPEDTQDELIPGTSIKRPRDRKIDETDEEYEAFLKKYYDKVFPPIQEKSLMVIPQEETLEDDELNASESEPVNEEKVTEPIAIEIDPNAGFVIDFDEEKEDSKENETVEEKQDEELTDEDIKQVVEESFKKEEKQDEELKDEDIDVAVEESFTKDAKEDETTETVEEKQEEELKDEDIDEAVEESLNEGIVSVDKDSVPEEEIKEEDINEVVDEELEASNIEASEDFKEELGKGSILYNIVHTVPKIVWNKIKSFFKPVHEFDGPEESTTYSGKVK